jgi:hypothetical protein
MAAATKLQRGPASVRKGVGSGMGGAAGRIHWGRGLKARAIHYRAYVIVGLRLPPAVQ